MWFESVDVRGFRGLSGHFDFARTLTVVVGDNEAGKSSLHEVLVRALFGFSKAERRRVKRSPSALERRAPWNGAPYRAIAKVSSDDRSFRIEWDFKKHEARLIDELGEDVSHQIRGMRDEVGLGEFLLGMGLDDFRQVCCIDQDTLLAVRHSPSLGVALQEAVANVAADVPVEDAIDALNSFLRTVVGARVDNFNPSPSGRLSALLREINGIKSDLAEAETARANLMDISRDRVKAREQHDEAAAELERVRQAQLLTALLGLESRLEEAVRLTSAAADRPGDGTALDQQAVDAVKALRPRLEELAAERQAAEADAAHVTEAVAALETEQRTLIAAVDGLELYAAIDDSARDRVQAAWSQLEGLEDAAELVNPPLPERDPAFARYREDRSKLKHQAAQDSRLTVWRVLWIVLVVATLGVAWVVRWTVRRIRGVRSTVGTGGLIGPYGGATFEELDAMVAEEDRRIIEVEAVLRASAEQRESQAARRRVLTREIEDALITVDAPAGGSLVERVRAYLIAASKHGELTAKRGDLERVRRELAENRRPQAELQRLTSETAKSEEALRNACGTLGIQEADLERAADAFDELVRVAAARAAQEQEAEKAAAALDSALQGESLDQLEARVGDTRRAFDEHRKSHGELESDPDDPERLRGRVAELEQHLRLYVEQAAQLETLEAQLEEAAGDPATLKEKLAVAEAEIERLSQAREAVRIARTLLADAADELRREFAPYLNEALAANIARITGGRYAEASVDSELAVSVVAPETGRLQSADDLSRATKDQLFLVQRLEIARLLAPTKGTPPLLLDDPFAHYDDKRLRYGLELVAEAAEERQIILFSEDRNLVQASRDACGTCEVIELVGPTAGHSLVDVLKPDR